MQRELICPICKKIFIGKAHNTKFCSYNCQQKNRLQKNKLERRNKIKRRKTKWSDKQLKKAVRKNFSVAGVLRDLNLKIYGSNHKNIKRRIKELNLNISHFTGKGHLKGKTHNWSKEIPILETFIKNSPYISCTNSLKKKIFKYKLLENKCYNCGLIKWKGQKIPLELHHINGIQNDLRLENLQILCPNCHALTKNYRGKNKNGGVVK